MEILVLDIETTGFYTTSDAIVEIGIALVNTKTNDVKLVFNNVVKDDKFNFDKHYNAWVFNNSSLTPEMVLNAKPFIEYKKEIQKLFDKYPMTAFNKSFDIRFMNNAGFKMNDIKCLMKSASKVVNETKKDGSRKSNISVVTAYNKFFMGDKKKIYTEEHRAGQDAIDESKILLHLVKLKETDATKIDNTESKKMTNYKNNTRLKLDFDVDAKLNFGKFKGQLISKVIKVNPGYINWCIENIPTFKMSEHLHKLLPKKF